MRMERLPGIHHDMSCIVVSGTEASIVIDPGTAWYQANVVERLAPHLDGRAPVAAILLSHRHYDACGGAPHIAAVLDCQIRIHESAVAPLAGADQFTTWATRYGSDMPAIETTGFTDGEVIGLGDADIHVLHTPGHTMDSCVFHIPAKSAVICGDLVPSQHHPVRADMPTGNLVDLAASLARVLDLEPELLICGRGPAISGKEACVATLEKHIESAVQRIEKDGALPAGWPKPAETCHWLTPEPAWSTES
jgi:glyoxylase-like metal-dependent hydrolase (beta-lactamase superfamily II)